MAWTFPRAGGRVQPALASPPAVAMIPRAMPAHLRVLLAGALFATGGALIKMCSFPSLQRAGCRAAVAAVALFVLLPAARRLPSIRTLLLFPPYFGATVLFVAANALTTSANAIFLQSTAPVWVALFGLVLLRERPRRLDVIVLGFIAAGMTLCFFAPAEASAIAADPALGNALALASGVAYALLLVGFRWLARRGGDEQVAAVAWNNLFTAPVALLLMPLFGQELQAGTAQDWVVIAFLGTFQVGLAYALLVTGVRGVPAVQAALLLMIEPALNPVITFFVHGERPHEYAIAGGSVIVLAVATGAVLGARRRTPPPAAAATPHAL